MTPRRVSLLVGLLCLIASMSVGASDPSIRGEISGQEFCPKSWCGLAIFGGVFYGKVGNKRAAGGFRVGVNYIELPTASVPSTEITGGLWKIGTINTGEFEGVILPGGTLTYNGDNTYGVSLTLLINDGGSGQFYFVEGELNHNPTFPTIAGTLVQNQKQQ
jgi:hypothetical protein